MTKSAIAPTFAATLLIIAFQALADPQVLNSQPRENALPSSLETKRDETSIPYKNIDLGQLRITTYANSRPSFSIPIGKDSSLSIKASHSNVGVVLKIPFE